MCKILSNDKLYKIYVLLNKSFLIYTTIVLYYRYKGLSFTQIMFLSSISAITTFLLEVPSGIIADRTKRKNLLIVSGVFTTFSLLIIFIAKSYWVIIIASVLMGISDAFESGADTAFIYDYFKNNDKEHEYGAYIKKVYRDSFIVTAFAAFLSGTLFSVNKNLPIIITIGLSILSLFTTGLFIEKEAKSEETNFKKLLRKETNVLITTFKNKGILRIIFIYVVMTLIISNINYLCQQYLVENNIPLFLFGVIFLAFNIASSIGANYAKTKNIAMKNILVFYSLILIGLYFSFGWIGVVLMILARIINGTVWPAMDVEFNKLIDSSKRATVLSYKSLMIQISFIIVDPIFGIITDATNVHTVYLIMSITILISLVIFLLINRKKQYLQKK